MSHQDRKRSQSRRTQASQPAQPDTKSAIAPGKRTWTQSLPAGSASASLPVQQKPDPAGEEARSQQAELTRQWLNTAARPDLYPPPVQMRGHAAPSPADVHRLAEQGVSGSATALPHLEQIQRSFGSHDVSGIQAHVGGPAAQASQAMGAAAYATGSHVAFHASPDLHTAAHEAAHVIQQRDGVQLAGGVGTAGDAYERHADAVADRVVGGQTAEDLLAAGPGGGGSHDAVQGDWLGAGVGALGGAAAGAGIGAVVGGPLGAAAGGLIGAAVGAVGGHVVEEALSSSATTVLSADTVTAVEQAINEGRQQDAIDAIVNDLSGQGRIDTSLLQGGGITYDSSVSGEGVANPPGYDGSGKALPTDVRIGDAAFTGGATLLHTSIMHEYWHVQQFQDAASSPSTVPGQGSNAGLIDQQEVEAYCWEIEHGDETGLSSQPRLMEDAWNRLHNNYWVNLSAPDRAPLTAKVTTCHQIAERVTGKTLVFNP